MKEFERMAEEQLKYAKDQAEIIEGLAKTCAEAYEFQHEQNPWQYVLSKNIKESARTKDLIAAMFEGIGQKKPELPSMIDDLADAIIIALAMGDKAGDIGAAINRRLAFYKLRQMKRREEG